MYIIVSWIYFFVVYLLATLVGTWKSELLAFYIQRCERWVNAVSLYWSYFINSITLWHGASQRCLSF